MARTCDFTVAVADHQAVGDLGVGGAPDHVAEDVVLAPGELLGAGPLAELGHDLAPERGHHPRRDLGVEPGAAGGHRPASGDQVIGPVAKLGRLLRRQPVLGSSPRHARWTRDDVRFGWGAGLTGRRPVAADQGFGASPRGESNS
jgi:hypothetical protein